MNPKTEELLEMLTEALPLVDAAGANRDGYYDTVEQYGNLSARISAAIESIEDWSQYE